MTRLLHFIGGEDFALVLNRILAGDLSECPEGHFSDDEWRREAQCAFDCDDDTELLAMLAEAKLRDLHDTWQRSASNEREADRRQFVDIEEGPFASAYFALCPVRVTAGMGA